jgi:hypothetical protein
MSSPAEHWNGVYVSKAVTDVSWFEERPATSIRLLGEWASPTDSFIDVGAGTSSLVDHLIEAQWRDVTLLDASAEALDIVRLRLGDVVPTVTYVTADVLHWKPSRTFRAWHDRAVFHFLVEPGERNAYVSMLSQAVVAGGTVILATFASDGPKSCSGLATARYDAAALADMFGEHFQLEYTERQEHVTPAGQVQPFTWVVLRRIGYVDRKEPGSPSPSQRRRASNYPNELH